MYIVTLNEAKKHLNIENSFTDDDSYITTLIDVAYLSIKFKCNNNTWIDISGNTTGTSELTLTGSTIPTVIKHAILLMVGNLYSQREPIAFASASIVPYTLEYLIQPFINYESR